MDLNRIFGGTPFCVYSFTMPVRRGRKGKQGGKQGGGIQGGKQSTRHPKQHATAAAVVPEPLPLELILTSDKRRGVYECDYCGADISQTPRIRCAVCDDFDLCCDCFATTDHVAATARLRAARAVAEQWHTGGAASTTPAAHDHDPFTHGYRVCDSTRYPLFPAAARSTSSGKPTLTALPSTAKKAKKVTVSTTSTTTSDVDSNDGTEENEFEPATVDQDSMDVDGETKAGDENEEDKKVDGSSVDDAEDGTAAGSLIMQAGDDVKAIWTVEEDLRLLQGIQTHGLGNWSDISEAVIGQGSTGKTAKRCMERYFDDYLGRHGYILPPYTLISESLTNEENDITGENDESESLAVISTTPGKASDSGSAADAAVSSTGGEATRSSKRRANKFRTSSSISSNGNVPSKKYKAVPTESLPEYQKVWPNPYLPKLDSGPVELGQEVGRDQAARAEQAYLRAISSLESIEQLERIRTEWEQNRLNKPGGPTVLPMRPDDVTDLPGSELGGFMPRRGDFDVEWENGAEEFIADMEFIPGEAEQDRQLKLQVLAIYNSKLDEREKRKKFVISRKLYDYRKYQQEYQQLPRDERDLVLRMRLFERFHTPAEHQQFIADLLKAKRLRKEIAKLQMYRRMGISTLLEAEKYELDKARRLFHKNAVLQKEAEAKRTEGTAGSRFYTKLGSAIVDDSESSSYWKQYRTTDRKVRRSINRSTFPAEGGKVDTANETLQGETAPAVANDAVVMATNKSTGETITDGSMSENRTEHDTIDVAAQKERGLSRDANSVTTSEAMEVDEKVGAAVENSDKNDLVHLPGYNLLSGREVDLCRSVGLQPTQYLDIKKALIYESLMQGLLDEKPNGNSKQRNNAGGKVGRKVGPGTRRTLVKIDVERRGTVIDFVVRAGWISAQFGKAVRDGF